MKLSELVRITPDAVNGFHVLELTASRFTGVKYVYGAVEVVEEGDHAVLRFDYQVISGDNIIGEDVAGFKHFIGDVLVMLIDEQVMNNGVVYSGGVDA